MPDLYRHVFRFTDGRWHVTPDLNIVAACYLLCTYGGFIQPQHEYVMAETVEVEDLPLATCPTTQPAPALTSADLAAARSAAAFHDSPKARETLAQWAAKKAKGRLKWLCRREVA